MIHSCGVVPVRFAPNPQYLLLSNHSHWDFPKGRKEDGEDFLEAALRELKEEADLSNPAFEWGLRYYETQPYSKPKKIARYYVGWFSKNAIVRLLPNPENGIIEHQEFRWFSYENAKAVVKPRILEVLEFARKTVEEKHGT